MNTTHSKLIFGKMAQGVHSDITNKNENRAEGKEDTCRRETLFF